MKSDVTRILDNIQAGDQQAANDLLPIVYEELRRIADAKMRHEKPGQTLQATALVHEAFLRLIGPEDDSKWDSRGHFFAAAAEAMRRILIEHARSRNAAKRGGKFERVELDEACLAKDDDSELILAIDEALSKLALDEPEIAKVVKLRYFTGLTIEQTAAALGLSDRTVKRHWTYARAWLQRELERDD